MVPTALLFGLAASSALVLGAVADWIAPKHLVASSFASGALITAVAIYLFEESYREGGPLIAFATAAGFLLSFLLAEA